MDRFLARAFSSAAAQDSLQENERPGSDKRPQLRDSLGPSGNNSSKPTTSPTASQVPSPLPIDGAAAILDAWEQKQYFRCAIELREGVTPCIRDTPGQATQCYMIKHVQQRL